MRALCFTVLASQLVLFLSDRVAGQAVPSADYIAQLQHEAASTNRSDWGHWGPDPEKYSSWTSHSNRLIPVYTFGIDLQEVSGENSIYRDEERLKQLFGYLPTSTLNPEAEYFDQTDVYRLQKMAAENGKKRIIVFVFDGMDWHTTRAAAIAKAKRVSYTEGRGQGLAFQDYRGTETDFGYFVTTPHNEGTSIDVSRQAVTNPGGKLKGGYDPSRGGLTPWAEFPEAQYPIGKCEHDPHAYTDSASSATSLFSGIKTYNDSVNVDFMGREAIPISRTLQDEGFAVGVVTSVQICHATPGCAYANNVHRNDYQDISRDLLGLPSSFHPGGLPGVDVLFGTGWGVDREKDGSQGDNYVPGNPFLTAADRDAINVANGGKYVVAERTPGRLGIEVLAGAVQQAKSGNHRLLGFFGTQYEHLPYQTADGRFDPVQSVGNPKRAKAEEYTEADLNENVTLAEFTLAAAEVLQSRSDRWWLMVEAGDVDWGNHGNNIDNSIGALLSGDEAFAKLTAWIEANGGWDDTALILTADHAHYLILSKPEALAGPEAVASESN